MSKADNIKHWLLTQLTINCGKCDVKAGIILANLKNTANDLFSLGWRVEGKTCYCPDCAKRLNIQQP